MGHTSKEYKYVYMFIQHRKRVAEMDNDCSTAFSFDKFLQTVLRMEILDDHNRPDTNRKVSIVDRKLYKMVREIL